MSVVLPEPAMPTHGRRTIMSDRLVCMLPRPAPGSFGGSLLQEHRLTGNPSMPAGDGRTSAPQHQMEPSHHMEPSSQCSASPGCISEVLSGPAMSLRMWGRCPQMTASMHMLRAWLQLLTLPLLHKECDGLIYPSQQGLLVWCRALMGSKPELRCTA